MLIHYKENHRFHYKAHNHLIFLTLLNPSLSFPPCDYFGFSFCCLFSCLMLNSRLKLSCLCVLHSEDWNVSWKMGREICRAENVKDFLLFSTPFGRSVSGRATERCLTPLLLSNAGAVLEEKNALMYQIILWLWLVPVLTVVHIVPNKIIHEKSGVVCSSCTVLLDTLKEGDISSRMEVLRKWFIEIRML